MKTIDKYVVREHAGPLMFALAALTSLLLLNYIAKQFGNLVGKGLPWSVIGEFFMLSVPFTVAMTLPMAVLVATLYAFSRLAAENEITALKASGISMPALLRPVLIAASGLAIIMLYFNDQVLPRANHRLRTLQSDIARKKPTFALRDQVINPVVEGRFYLKAGWIDPGSNRMRDVTIWDLSDPSHRRTIYADSGSMALSTDGQDLRMTLHSGYMQELPRNTPGELQRLFYRTDRIRISGVGNQLERTGSDSFKSDREMSICEMHDERSRAELEHRSALLQSRATILNAVNSALGRRIPVTPPIDSTPDRTLSTAYCAIVHAINRVLPGEKPSADTAGKRTRATMTSVDSPFVTVQALQAMPRPGDPGTRNRHLNVTPGAALAAPREEPPPQPQMQVVPPPSAGGSVSNSIETARMRVEDSRRRTDAYDVEIQKKFALSAACIVFVLLGAPVALRFPRGGVGLTIGVSLGVFALYYVGLIAGESLADHDILSPFIAMWAANFLSLIVGLALLARMGRESSTARGGDFREVWDNLKAKVTRRAPEARAA